LKLTYIAEHYRELLDDAARKNSPMLEVLIQLIGGQLAARRDSAVSNRRCSEDTLSQSTKSCVASEYRESPNLATIRMYMNSAKKCSRRAGEFPAHRLKLSKMACS
ncbi:MAG TPA: hypothetical protein VM260_17195, partial [Pirellula sp.]|nr:hypothetical protein [Pirellula sp.]